MRLSVLALALTLGSAVITNGESIAHREDHQRQTVSAVDSLRRSLIQRQKSSVRKENKKITAVKTAVGESQAKEKEGIDVALLEVKADPPMDRIPASGGASSPYDRFGASSVVADGKIFTFGGVERGGAIPSADLLQFDPASRSW